MAELAQARASGELDALNSDNPAFFFQARKAAPGASKTRAQVQAELKQAQQSGELAALNSEDPTALQRFAAAQAAKKTETMAE